MSTDGPTDGVASSLPTDVTLERAAPALQAVAAAVAAIGVSYAVAGPSPAFVVAPVADLVVAFTPDALVTLSITVLGDLGKLLAAVTAVGVTVAVLAAGSFPGVTLSRDRVAPGGLLAGVVVAAVTMVLTGTPGSALAAGTGAALVVVVPRVVPDGPADPGTRRELLAAVGTAVGTGLLGVAVARSRTESGSGPPASGTGEASGGPEGEVGAALAAADERSLDVDGLEPLVSTSFYTVDVAQFDPEIDTGEWTLSVTGNVGEELTHDYEDLTGREAEHRFVSLRCVGEELNGEKLDTALWTGIPVWDLVAPADPAEDCCVRLHAEDGYYQVFPLEALKRGFLAYGMNGDPLPRAHGAPARTLVPGHWGEINVKWLTEIEVLDEEVEGYWEERGWHGTGPVNTVAKLWVTNHLDDGRIEVAGHAYAGTRGVRRVEVSTDGGGSWTEAALSDPPPVVGDGTPTPPPERPDGTPTPEGPDRTSTSGRPDGTPTPGDASHGDVAVRGRDVWRQWVHRYDPPDGPHDVVVRAVDGTGTVQPRERSGSFPSGATGWVTKTVRP